MQRTVFLKNPIEFGKSYKSFVEINFIEMPDAVELVQRGEEQRRYAAALVRPDFRTAYQGGNARFFDEVQECPEIVTAIKFLVDEGSYRYILSGSLLGGLKDLRSEPVGYIGVKDMYPLDFEEFISCGGYQRCRDRVAARSVEAPRGRQ